MNRAAVVGCLILGAIWGGLTGPIRAAYAGRAPWWAVPLFWVAVGPFRWAAWVVAGAWVESAWNPDAVGDGGSSVGVLQYNDAAIVAPADRTSPWQSAVAAGDYTLSAIARGRSAGSLFWSLAYLRAPFVGYAGWRWVWKSGQGPMDVPTDDAMGRGEIRDREVWAAVAQGFVVAIGAIVLWYVSSRVRA